MALVVVMLKYKNNMLASVMDENTWKKYTSKNKKKLGYYSILYLRSISIVLENVRKALVF